MKYLILTLLSLLIMGCSKETPEDIQFEGTTATYMGTYNSGCIYCANGMKICNEDVRLVDCAKYEDLKPIKENK